MNEIYETKISDKRWMVYDVLGNIGWIIWFVCLYLCLKEGVTTYAVMAVFPALLMLTGIVELISERIARLDRILPRIRLLRGFGALTFGGILGIPISIIGLCMHQNASLPLWMLSRAILCAVFAWLCFHGYKKQ